MIVDLEMGKRMLDLKNEVGHLFLFKLNNIRVICRPLFVKELETLQSMQSIISSVLGDNPIIDSWIVERCLVYSNVGEDLFSTEKAGYIATIANGIIKKSNPENFEKIREKISQEDIIFDSLCAKLLSKVPGFPVPDRYKLTRKNQLEFIARIEHLLGEDLLGEKSNSNNSKYSKDNKKKSWITSKQAADKVDIDEDNSALNRL